MTATVASIKTKTSRRSSFEGTAVLALSVAIIVALPCLVVLGFLAVPKGEVWSHLASTVLPRYIGNSFALMLLVAIGVVVGGVSSAWLATMCRFPGREIFEWALLLPLAMPAYVIAYTYTGLFDFAGPVQSALRAWFGWGRGDYWFPEIRSLGGAAILFSLVLYPYVYMLARAAFLEQSVCVQEASRVLGRGPWGSFFSVALPLARPAIVAGTALALMETLNDFGTVQYFAVDTFTTGIYRTWFGLGDSTAAAQLGSVLMIFVLALLVTERLARGQAKYHHTTSRYRPLPGYSLSGWRAGAAFTICMTPVLFGFLLPGGVLLFWSIETASEIFDARFFFFARNSLLLAALTAILAVGLSLPLAYLARRKPGMLASSCLRMASMGYAVPGSVIAVGALLPAAAFDNALDGFLRERYGISSGLLLTGTIAALIYAYLVRFLAVAYGTVEASLAKITPSMDGAARTLGLSPQGVIRRVHMPIMRGSLLTAGLLVFVDVMKELPATLIMRPFNFDTLAVRTYQLAADERLRDAAGPGLAIVAVGILPVILLSRAIRRTRPGQSGAGD